MKSLYLIRHANSPFINPDHERPLDELGEQEALYMSIKLKTLNTNPDLIISSSAKRTVTTSLIISETLNCKDLILINQEAYNASFHQLNDIVCNINDTHKNVFLISHNPGISSLVNFLTDDNFNQMPPCGIAKINFEIDNWQEIIKGSGNLKWFITPNSSI